MASGAGDGKWKVVKKGKKNGGCERKALGDSNLTMGVPIKTSSTLYEMGFEKIKKQNKEQVPPSGSESAPPKKPDGGKSTKKLPSAAPGPAQSKFCTLEEAMKVLDVSVLQREMERSQNLFPGNPSIWLKDLAGYLNDKLQVPRGEPTLSQHPYDYPYCLVSKDLKNTIRSLLAKAQGVLDIFVDHCVCQMLSELEKPKGDSLHGYRICVQAVLLDKPKTVTSNLKKFWDLIREHEKRPVKCLAVMWVVGQAGYADLAEGLKVWLGVMLPVLGKNPLSSYAISYLDRLLLMHSNLTKGFGMVGPKEFFPLLDFTFMPRNSLSQSQQSQLRDLYPRLKVLAFGASPESALHTFFPSFISRATPNCPADMKKELMLSLSECLNLDPLSFSVWRQLYTKHLPQSKLLLEHLVETWGASSKSMRKSLRETAESFKVTNAEFSAKGQNVRDIAASDATCQVLLQKMKGGRIPWFRIFLVALVFISGFVIHDIRTHGSFEESSSAQLLRRSQLLPAFHLSRGKVAQLCQQGHSWLEANVPQYYSHAAETLGPHLELLWTKSKEGSAYTYGKCSSLINGAVDNMPWFIEWVQSRIPDSVYRLLEYLRELLLYIHRSVLIPAVQHVEAAAHGAWRRYVESCNGEASWDCLVGHVSNFTHSSWTYLQHATLAVKDWALAMISGS